MSIVPIRKRSRPILHANRARVAAPADPRDTANPPAAGDDAARRLEMIAVAAYFLAQKRGFSPGREVDDWLDAEREVDATQPDPHAGTSAGPG